MACVSRIPLPLAFCPTLVEMLVVPFIPPITLSAPAAASCWSMKREAHSGVPAANRWACRAETDAPSAQVSLGSPLRLDLDPPLGKTAGTVGEKA